MFGLFILQINLEFFSSRSAIASKYVGFIYCLTCDRVYEAIDQDGDGALSEGELKAFVIGMHLEGMSVGTDDIVHKVLQEFDTERRDGKIDFDEFKNGISKLLSGFVKRDRAPHESTDNIKYIDAVDEVISSLDFLFLPS